MLVIGMPGWLTEHADSIVILHSELGVPAIIVNSVYLEGAWLSCKDNITTSLNNAAILASSKNNSVVAYFIAL